MAYDNRELALNKLKENENSVPGFEAIFAITGLLAVAYLLRRNE
jgi:PGF-CTERM protein